MSRGRRQVIQLNEPARILYSNEPTINNEEEDDDSAGDMPTPERLITEVMLPGRPGADGRGGGFEPSRPTPGAVDRGGGFEIDNKVANFLAEIDALDPGTIVEPSRSPVPARPQDVSPPRERYSPPRERSPVRPKPNAYSNMFVKGTPEFVQKQDKRKDPRDDKKLEPWPKEPKSEWKQLTDETTNYPYYWNMNTNAVVWNMPGEFSQFLLRQKEFEEKVERGLREGTLDPEHRGESAAKLGLREGALDREQKVKIAANKQEGKSLRKLEDDKHSEKLSKSHARTGRRPSHSEDSSSDSSDSAGSQSHGAKHNTRKSRPEKGAEVSSSSAENSRAAGHDKLKRSATPELPDSTRPDDKKVATNKPVPEEEESMDFDIDDIDKELEMALERKRQELMELKKKSEEKTEEKDKPKEKKKDEQPRYREDDRTDDRHRKHGRYRELERDRERERDGGRNRKHRYERDEKKTKLTLKERLRIEMELKMDKEKRKKRAIEDMMARELEQTVGIHKRHRDERINKRYRNDDDRGHYRPARADYSDYGREYDSWDNRGASLYDERLVPPPTIKAPPPTDEMIAYEEERRSQVVDYEHGRSSRLYDMNGDSDTEEVRSADAREMEIKKLESLQLAELALSKLEFLEVTKKGLSKLQILLIELETRHQDWQAGGLTTNHFLGKLREANWQLEQYEASAAPGGWVCSWDRDYRRYFYTHKQTGKNQWDYPDADDIRVEDEKAQQPRRKISRGGREPEPEISSTSDKGKRRSLEKEILASMKLPPPPPPPAEEHPSVRSLCMYGSSSESETEEPNSKKVKKEPDVPDIQDVPLPPPPEEPHNKKDRKDKHHKKKKKKEKSKKKEKEKSEAGVMGPVGPSLFPPVGVQPPTPSQGTGSVVTAEPRLTIANMELQPNSEVPVYGTVGDDQSGQNDQPLEFGSVPEAGSLSYIEDVGRVEAGVISHGPQMATLTHEPETYNNPTLLEASGGGEPASEALLGEGKSEVSIGAVPNTEEKKKKKKEKMGSGSISLKKKHVSSMVQKWQKVKKEVELEEQHRQVREAEIRRKLAELD